MAPRSLSIVVCVLSVALLAGGCGKKKKSQTSDSEFSSIPSLGADSMAKKDSGDIFDEFYEEDKAKAKAVKPSAASRKPAFGGSFSENGRYVVQVSCVASERLAGSVVSKLQGEGYPAYLAQVENPTPSLMGTFYRVRVGGFAAISDAKSFAENSLTPAGYEYWVDNKSNDNVGMEGYGLGQSAPSGYDSPTSSPNQGSGAAPAASSGWETTPSTPSSASTEWRPEPQAPAAAPPAAPAASSPASAAPQPAATPQPKQPAPTTTDTGWGDSDWGGGSSW